ncbi:hypothetical protein SAMN05661091_3432 [Paenibacillus uliginis N3/975]|uniref:Uncharacterized protein n=1 Tax=Paenibacillus uliginis N3/975 TaxID=1313296 RepID=A0A1X7HH09_9BACL|nr:hypothetical protein [Paenibacillus uliginis]SMF86580.1 hypothetical protein SAMN05661091_3432 [Paenibacillus uliginis N3/975]
METWVREIITHIAAFSAGATLTFVVQRITLNNSKNYKVNQNKNTVKGDLIGRDKKVGK